MSNKKNDTFQVLVLDADRNPIKDLRYRLYVNGAMISGETSEAGLTKKISTRTPNDEVQIAIERMDKSIKIIARVIAGVGNKLITLVSPRVQVVSSTLPHPVKIPSQLPDRKEAMPPIYDPQKTKVLIEKNGFGPKVEQTKNKEGQSVLKVEGDIPNLEFLDDFNGEEMSEEDYLWAAKTLEVEYEAIKAFAIVESQGAGFIEHGSKTLPKILYERHKFAKFTKNIYSELYPDISLPCQYYNTKDRYVPADAIYKKKRDVPENISYYRPVSKRDNDETRERAAPFKQLVNEGRLERSVHLYQDGIGSYKRLVKAYKLDPKAALQSCSWGAFQIMGEYWEEMGYVSVIDFSRAMSRSSKEQVRALVLYINHVNPKIKKLLHSKNWDAVACAYNGPNYEVNEYHIKLRKEYEKLKASKLQ